MSNPTKANVAKVLGIKLKRPEPELAQLNHNSGICSIQTLEQYLEKEPSTAEYLHQFVPEAHDVVDYLWSLFPFLHWVGRYNLQWLAGDLVAGTCWN
jgi:sodium-independent sulfate anion transporter 11